METQERFLYCYFLIIIKKMVSDTQAPILETLISLELSFYQIKVILLKLQTGHMTPYITPADVSMWKKVSMTLSRYTYQSYQQYLETYLGLAQFRESWKCC